MAYQTLKILTRAIRVLMDCQGSSFTSPYPSQLSFQMQVAVTMKIVQFTLLECCLEKSTLKSWLLPYEKGFGISFEKQQNMNKYEKK